MLDKELRAQIQEELEELQKLKPEADLIKKKPIVDQPSPTRTPKPTQPPKEELPTISLDQDMDSLCETLFKKPSVIFMPRKGDVLE